MADTTSKTTEATKDETSNSKDEESYFTKYNKYSNTYFATNVKLNSGMHM